MCVCVCVCVTLSLPPPPSPSLPPPPPPPPPPLSLSRVSVTVVFIVSLPDSSTHYRIHCHSLVYNYIVTHFPPYISLCSASQRPCSVLAEVSSFSFLPPSFLPSYLVTLLMNTPTHNSRLMLLIQDTFDLYTKIHKDVSPCQTVL